MRRTTILTITLLAAAFLTGARAQEPNHMHDIEQPNVGSLADLLERAVLFGHADELRELIGELRRRGDPLPVETDDGTLLHLAARSTHPTAPEIVRQLVEAGHPVDARNGRGATPLHSAAHNREQPTATVLLAAGAVLEALDDWGRSPLFYARGDNVHMLIAAGADPDRVDNEGETPLTRGVANAAALVEAGQDINARDRHGLTQLHRAALTGDLDRVRSLLAAGIDPTIRTERDYSPRQPGEPPRFADDPTDDIPAGWTALQIAERKHRQKGWVTGVHGEIAQAIRERTGERAPIDWLEAGFRAFFIAVVLGGIGVIAGGAWVVVRLIGRAASG